MINHFRTLLLNEEESSEGLSFGQYIPPYFIPRTLTGLVASVHEVLMPRSLDRNLRELRASTIFSAILDLNYETGILVGFDDRLTFDPRDLVSVTDFQESKLKFCDFGEIQAKLKSLPGLTQLFYMGGEDGKLFLELKDAFDRERRPDKAVAILAITFCLTS